MGQSSMTLANNCSRLELFYIPATLNFVKFTLWVISASFISDYKILELTSVLIFTELKFYSVSERSYYQNNRISKLFLKTSKFCFPDSTFRNGGFTVTINCYNGPLE